MGSDPITVGELGERGLIERIKARIPPAPPFVLLGIGDDAAVIEPARNAVEVLTTDCQVEGIHFDQRFASAADIGHKALAVNLSDLAAMGAVPRVALLSLVLPPAWPVASIDGLLDGVLGLAARDRIAIVGGNIARSPGPVIVDITVTGSVHRRQLLSRGGARGGDELYVTGTLGGAAAGLRALQSRHDSAALHTQLSGADNLIMRYVRPDPRTQFGVMLGRNRAARACIDLSDGLADGVRQLAQSSGLGAIIDLDAVPIDSGATLRDALEGGEDYELLFAVGPSMRSRLQHVRRLVKQPQVTRIGRLTADPALLLTRNGSVETLPAGFAHFA